MWYDLAFLMKLLITFSLVLWTALSAHAFALRGPLEPWMTTNLTYGLAGDFGGGPMALGNEYRWNLPVLTYGFDQSFLSHFGERGVQAVQEAIAILNALPPVSQIDLAAFSNDTRFVNFEAQALGLMDVKSMVLGLLLRQLGLAEPERYAWTLRARNASATQTNYVVVQKNYDPGTLDSSAFVNHTEYAYEVLEARNTGVADAVEFIIDPFRQGFNAAASLPISAGEFLSGLTPDDAGGLRYLYNPTNINVEPLPIGVKAVSGTIVDVAPRPGVDKITFTRMQWDANRSGFATITNVFTDTYLSNGVPLQQTLQRVLDRPDITFRARDLPLLFRHLSSAGAYGLFGSLYQLTDARTWTNHAALNGRPGLAGPGTIPSGQTIDLATFSRYTHGQFGSPSATIGSGLGSFDGTTNAPVVYGLDDAATSATIESRIVNGAFVWKLVGTYQAEYRIDSTTDFVIWTPVLTVTNDVGYFSVTNPVSASPTFYRAVRTRLPQ
jgi:hypothetical protein